MSFYNTIDLPKDLLIKELVKVKKQNLKVLTVFKVAGLIGLTPADVFNALSGLYPITSIRRAISDFTDDGKLIKTGKMRVGLYGKPNYVWRLKLNK